MCFLLNLNLWRVEGQRAWGNGVVLLQAVVELLLYCLQTGQW